jgi:geranylgeranyl pyrophosphate synthase
MLVPIQSLPRTFGEQRWRPTQDNVPPTRADRDLFKAFIRDYVGRHQHELVPPLVLDELRRHAEAVVRELEAEPKFADYAGVLLNNEIWREQLATVPFERRLLLLPKCLRVEDKCPAPFDEFGLLCKQCGLCSIQDLQEEAERMGYACLVAEGSALVMAMIQTGKIEAIVGVSCLSVLERAFPYMEAAAIPGIAIPLNQDDCKDTTVDLDWIWEVIHLTSDDRTRRLDLDALRRQTDLWFEPEALDAIFGGPAQNETERIARQWLARAGKRWRPFLAVCAYQALQADPRGALPEGLRKVALAVECFHKASLVHDDIEDEDVTRYGEATLHVEHGVPVALNAGDLLIGEGYRLLAESGAPAALIARMISVAANGHRALALGQGDELCWARDRQPLSALQVLEIFRRKTAPAFEVALRLGVAYAGGDEYLDRLLARYSEALGIAYQIRDDIEDFLSGGDSDDVRAMRPSLPLAIAWDRAKGENKLALQKAWCEGLRDEAAAARVREMVVSLGAAERARQLLEGYKEQSVRTLTELDHASMKGLLRRVVGKIFSIEIQGWCSEFEARNAASGAARAQAVG